MSTLPVTIRPATPADRDTIVAFNAAIAQETENKTLELPVLTAGVDALLADSALGRYFIAERNDEFAGQTMITYEWSDWRNGLFWWIQSVYVAPQHRQAGVFTALYRHIEQLAEEEAGVCGLRLYVDKHNARATGTYHRLGMHTAHYDMLEVEL